MTDAMLLLNLALVQCNMFLTLFPGAALNLSEACVNGRDKRRMETFALAGAKCRKVDCRGTTYFCALVGEAAANLLVRLSAVELDARGL